MSGFLANENVPAEAVALARQQGFDVHWVLERMRGATDDEVLALSMAEGRVLITFDKDFGEMAFRLGRAATCGVILLRTRLKGPDDMAQFLLAVLNMGMTWEGHFAVAREGQLRLIPLPE